MSLFLKKMKKSTSKVQEEIKKKKEELEKIKKELLLNFKNKRKCPTENEILDQLKNQIISNKIFENKSFCIDVTKIGLDIEDNYHKDSCHLATDFLNDNIFYTENFIIPLVDSVFDIHIYFPYFSIKEEII